MKIHELRFKNLNSLYGEWKIDFTAPVYADNGIFAITGPTGAGKSTILDALCLALYGTTPRLGRITKSGNEVMSRQTGECFAEVVFESKTGVYRCNWHQHRARKQANGKLAEAEHEIADARTGQVLESKKTATVALIEEKTGMDMERFTRSILLAQGGFAAFLQATPDGRAPILEQITGTEIYSDISKRVYERQKEARVMLDVLQAEVKGITLFSSEQEQAYNTQLTDLQARETVTAARLQEIQAAIAWLRGIENLEKQLAVICGEETAIAEALVKFQPERNRLELARKAADLEGEYATLSAQRRQQQKETADLTADLVRLPEIEQQLALKAGELAHAGEMTARAKAEQQQVTPRITATRALDIQIANKTRQLTDDQRDQQSLLHQIRDNHAARATAAARHAEEAVQLAKLAADLESHKEDEKLVTQMAGITERLSRLLGLANDLVRKQQVIEAASKQLVRAAGASQQVQGELDSRQVAFQRAQADAEVVGNALRTHLGDRLLREYRAEQAGLLRELALRQKIVSLETERQALADGNPCPLCGSTSHPYAAGNIPALNETELRLAELNTFIDTAEQLEEKAKACSNLIVRAQANLSEVEKQLVQAAGNQEKAETEQRRLVQEQADLAEQYRNQHDGLLAELQPLGISELPNNRIQSIAASMQERLKDWLAGQKEKARLELEVLKTAEEIRRLDALNEPLARANQEKIVLIASLNKERETLIGQRAACFGDKNPDQEEKRLADQIIGAETVEMQAREAHRSSQTAVEQLKTRIGQHQAALSQLEPALAALEQSWIASLTAVDFIDEAAFLASRLTADQRQTLTEQSRQLDDRKGDISTRRQDREIQLTEERSRQLTTAPLADLTGTLGDLNTELTCVSRDIGAIQQNLANNARAKVTLQESLARIAIQKDVWLKWSKLNELIGSADGKKFRNFAQGITFELLIAHANRQLEKLTDRYLLIRDEEYPLELNVVDNYQAGEVRSTKNLSGGESFIVSLALALGLSKMSSSKVRVDSLFLDEGFGTLDEDTLETALETLASLQQDGKLIGIISHVPALKERISTQINVTPASGGRSVISGPGVSRL